MSRGVHRSQQDVAVLGYACRLPGAETPSEFWDVLTRGVCTVSDRPEGRWDVERFLHPGQAPGYSYTFAGGYLQDVLGFDAGVFGISPREAGQIDPQQRLLLEVVWEALEDAGLVPSRLSGEGVGVYVGASNVDYQTHTSMDLAAIQSHFIAGNSLAIIANRVSYAFNWKGPSVTTDAACASSFAALHQAMRALSEGEVDLAVVAGVNLLLSPAPFIGFSAARMLSPTGRCRPFSAQGDGYVRSEGLVAVVLRRLGDARANGEAVRSVVLGSAINSDGRTVGISLPSVDGQRSLLEGLYADLELSVDRLAFVEAHGTGTPVGDPVEATAIGTAIAQHRSAPLPIGSVKSNIGHLEPVSGLAGMLKASMALQKRLLPKTLFLEELNPHIDFPALNLKPVAEPLPLKQGEPLLAGVCNFGFGGTNVHVVLRGPTAEEASGASRSSGAKLLLLSAQSGEALAALAGRYADLVEAQPTQVAQLASAAAHRRERMEHRLAVPLGAAPDVSRALRSAAAGETPALGARGQAGRTDAKVAFVFTGNGCQWPGMGRRAYARNPAFREHVAAIDALFEPLSGWSILQTLHDPGIAAKLRETRIAQPLLFAIQSSLVAALRSVGVTPALVLGHSVGEVAAAEACGALSLREAVRLIHTRSLQQERIRGQGRMAVVALGEAEIRAYLDRHGIAHISVAAINSPASVTLSGPTAELEDTVRALKRERVPGMMMDLDYPFHSAALDPLEEDIIGSLSSLKPRAGSVPFISTVTGGELGGKALDCGYWWRNIRLPVLFAPAVARASELGATLFLEVSPRPILINAIGDTLRAAGNTGEAVASLTEEEGVSDPVWDVAAKLLVRGASLEEEPLLGRPGANAALPLYPWQHGRHGLPQTSERLKLFGTYFRQGPPRHPLVGTRVSEGSMEWHQSLDARMVPYLADHVVDGAVIMPGAGYVEMLLAVGADVFGDVPLCVRDLDIERPMVLTNDGMRELSVRFISETSTVEVWSRKRLSTEEWTRHVHGQVRPAMGEIGAPPAGPGIAGRIVNSAEDVYDAARRAGLDYGPSFRRVVRAVRDPDALDVVFSDVAPPTGAFVAEQLLDPTSLDACLHGLLLTRSRKAGEVRSYLPIRMSRVTLLKPRTAVVRAIVRRVIETDRSSTVDMALYDAAGDMVALADGVHLKVVVLSRRNADDRVLRLDEVLLAPRQGEAVDPVRSVVAAAGGAEGVPDSWLLLQAFALSLVQRWMDREGIASGDDHTHGPVATAALALAGAFGLLEPDDGRPVLPAPDTILAALAERFPAAQAEILLAAHALAHFEAVARSGRPVPLALSQVEHLEAELAPFAAARDGLMAALDLITAEQAPAPLSVLWTPPWNMGLWRALLPRVREGSVLLSLGTAEAAEFDAFMARHGRGLPVGRFDPVGDATGRSFDVTIGFAASATALAAAARLNATGSAVIADPVPNLVADLLLAVAGLSREPSVPDGPALGQRLAAAGLDAVAVEEGPAGFIHFASGRAPSHGREEALLRRVLAVGTSRAAIGRAVLDAVAGVPGIVMVEGAPETEDLDGVTDLVEMVDTGIDTARMRSGLRERILALVGRLSALPSRPERLRYWLALGVAADAPQTGVVAHTLRAFARVAMNEFPTIDLRVIEFDEDLGAATVAADLVAAMTGAESELRLAEDGVFVPRARRRPRRQLQPVSQTERTLLLPKNGVAPEDFAWTLAPRAAPGSGEVEIRVAHAGLNFRDLMIALGILDEDLLSGGLTHGAFGFECAGVVERVGADVTEIRPGDPVMAFVANAFASHVTVSAAHVVPVPAGISLAEAATIPVAFSTAWYALEEVARIRPGERVLIHGGVGAVGMAAIQIARRRGAVVYATAGTATRRALARALGAEQTFDSRSLAFVEALRAQGGVDVVLNSLSGEAMREGLRVLRPFGRFLELGKRDYLNDAAIRLRPFVHNLTYCGIDLDELLGHDLVCVNRVMRDLMACFADGSLRPLPYRTFASDEVAEALQLMRSAEHMGKLTVTPATAAAAEPSAFRPAPDGVHLVVGGTGGLGLATALWLAEQGASHVAVASRRGVIDPLYSARVAALEAGGCSIHAFALDVSDAAAVDRFVAELQARFGAVRGVVHTAMVLNDGMLANMSAEQLDTVLTPKVDGVLALDRATRGMMLDYFVVFSSATTLIGSPGQGAYVAGNAFLEGVVRRRRADGLAGLAVGWGAISDTGVLARDRDLAERLRRTTGVSGITSDEALTQLGRLLAAGEAAPEVNFFADIGHSLVAEKLAILATPAFAGMLSASGVEPERTELDLAARLAGTSRAEASVILVDVISREIAKILRLPLEGVDPRRPLGEMGMDSLMALELRLGLEQSCGIEMPIISIGGRTVEDLVQQTLSLLHGSEAGAADTADVAQGVSKFESYGAAGDAAEKNVAAIRQLGQTGGRLT